MLKTNYGLPLLFIIIIQSYVFIYINYNNDIINNEYYAAKKLTLEKFSFFILCFYYKK